MQRLRSPRRSTLVTIAGLSAMLAACSSEPSPTSAPAPTSADGGSAGPVFVPDKGIRIDNAGNAKAGFNSDATKGAVGTYLYHQAKGAGGSGGAGGGAAGDLFAVAADGLSFAAASKVVSTPGGCKNGGASTRYLAHPERLELPDQSGWRMYTLKQGPNATFEGFGSRSSTDGVDFCEDEGSRYGLGPNDKGTMGVYTTFPSTRPSGVVLLYLGDLFGANNTRRATAGPDGLTFAWDRDDVLGDAALGGGGKSYVDISTLPIGNSGRRRLFAMKGGGGIHSAITDDDGRTFRVDEGTRVSTEDFGASLGADEKACGLFDPTVVQYRDASGSVTHSRMYVTAMIVKGCNSMACEQIKGNASCVTREALLSATHTGSD